MMPRRAILGGLLCGNVPSVVEDSSGSGWKKLGEQIEDSGLTRAVRTDQGVDGAAFDFQIDIVDGDETLEFLLEMLRLQNDVAIHAVWISAQRPKT